MPWQAAVRLPSRRPGASLDLGPLDLVFLEAAVAADLITATTSLTKIETKTLTNIPKVVLYQPESQMRV